ncbi:hypothetical protein NSPZN2_40349 [Nitrospira defluvii]|uniref:Uncharacterized protein n=1 Tax=Nitrospira defluvii TaxID=330214 RepID=A0ABM8RUF5_9BACT|nr:hypothetical protein NSPZN2_40349 [Nitrospira defluvii]
MSFDRDTTLTLQVHRVEDLLLRFPGSHCASCVEEPVGEGRFTVIDMGDDREISDETLQILAHVPQNRFIIVTASKVVKEIARRYNPRAARRFTHQARSCRAVVVSRPVIP